MAERVFENFLLSLPKLPIADNIIKTLCVFNITPPLKGGYLTPHHPPVFCAIDVIIGRYRVLILSMSRVLILACVV